MKIVSYILTIIGTVIGGLILVSTLTAESAPQQAAGAAMALAWGVLPYCFARAIEKIGEVTISDALGRYFEKRPIAPTPKPVMQPRGVTQVPHTNR